MPLVSRNSGDKANVIKFAAAKFVCESAVALKTLLRDHELEVRQFLNKEVDMSASVNEPNRSELSPLSDLRVNDEQFRVPDLLLTHNETFSAMVVSEHFDFHLRRIGMSLEDIVHLSEDEIAIFFEAMKVDFIKFLAEFRRLKFSRVKDNDRASHMDAF